ncbi:MAG: ribokinase, partial [Anaerolineales bacterium]
MSELEGLEAPVLVIGSSGLDLVGRSFSPLRKGTSNPGHLRVSPGGVARNVAENLARLGLNVILITAVGDDQQGHQILQHTRSVGVDVEHCIRVADQPTGSYLAVLDDQGLLHLGMDDMRVVGAITSEYLRQRRDLFKQASAVFLDANLSEKTLRTAISLASRSGVPIAADPTSSNLAPRLLPFLERLWLITPNET